MLTFVAVLSAGTAVRPSPPHDHQPDAGTAASRLDVPPGLVAAPVAVPDASVAGLVGPGDRVDVVGTDPRGHASVVAPGAVVLWRPVPEAATFGPDPDGGTVLMVAVPEATALLLAAATVTGQLSLTIPAE
ncbi:MAG: hypothetical protein OEW53_08855 [Actinomycetota bacterium]|nr:hypothetical protein [Actinomycetota bacterium]